jgi:hypothetical protein
MPSISRVPPLRIEVENKNPQPVMCKTVLKEAISLSPNDNIKKYLGSSEFFWKGDSKSIIREKIIDPGTVGTLYVADICKKNSDDEFLYFVMQDEINEYVKPFRKLGEYRIICEIRGVMGDRPFIMEIDLTFEVVKSPKTNKRFIRTVQSNIPRGD